MMRLRDKSRKDWSYISEVVVESVEVDWLGLISDSDTYWPFFILSVP